MLEVWVALYRFMISMFLKQSDSPTTEDLLKVLSKQIMASKTKFNSEVLHKIMSETHNVQQFDKFKAFIQELASIDSTCRFWIQFVLQGIAAYVGLFLAIESEVWYLRIASAKQMEPVFTAFDHALNL